jgi:hypothetical protein
MREDDDVWDRYGPRPPSVPCFVGPDMVGCYGLW